MRIQGAFGIRFVRWDVAGREEGCAAGRAAQAEARAAVAAGLDHRLAESVKRQAKGLAEGRGSYFVTTASTNHQGAGFKGGVVIPGVNDDFVKPSSEISSGKAAVVAEAEAKAARARAAALVRRR